MKIDRKLAKEIRLAVVKLVGFNARCEVGARLVARIPGKDVFNWLQFKDYDDHDLVECVPLHKMGKIDIGEVDGAVEIDIYVSNDVELVTNVTARVENGKLVAVFEPGPGKWTYDEWRAARRAS